MSRIYYYYCVPLILEYKVSYRKENSLDNVFKTNAQDFKNTIQTKKIEFSVRSATSSIQNCRGVFDLFS